MRCVSTSIVHLSCLEFQKIVRHNRRLWRLSYRDHSFVAILRRDMLEAGYNQWDIRSGNVPRWRRKLEWHLSRDGN